MGTQYIMQKLKCPCGRNINEVYTNIWIVGIHVLIYLYTLYCYHFFSGSKFHFTVLLV